MWEGYPLMEGLAWWALALIYIGVVAAGIAMAYAIYQWRQARREETLGDKARRERATREVFRGTDDPERTSGR